MRWCCLLFAVACSNNKTEPPKQTEPPKPTEPAKPVATAVDLSGKWECIWNVPDGDGSETWMLMQEGTAVRATLSGKDPGGKYSGTLTGTFDGKTLTGTSVIERNIKATVKMTLSANGKLLDGESKTAEGGTTSRYGCSRT
jgi:hypothetical protein